MEVRVISRVVATPPRTGTDSGKSRSGAQGQKRRPRPIRRRISLRSADSLVGLAKEEPAEDGLFRTASSAELLAGD